MPAKDYQRIRVHLIRAVLLVLAYALATRFLNPGFFEPLVPSHSDIWRYFAYSREPFTLAGLTAPRPVMLFAIKFLGLIPDFRTFALALLLPALLLPAFVLATAERALNASATYAMAFLYFFLSFVLPSFYQLQMLDFGGCIAGILACLAINAFDGYVKEGAERSRNWRPILVPLALVWLSMEAKPTYAAVLAFIPVIYYRKIGWQKVAVSSGLAAAIILAVLVKDKLLGSPFLDTSGASDSAYRIAPSLSAVMGSFRFYVAALLPKGAWPFALLALGLAVVRWGWRTSVVIGVMAVLAVLPMIAIPNNLLPMYSWFGAVVLLLPVSFLFTDLDQSRVRAMARLAAFPLLLLAVLAIFRSEPTARYWYGSNQLANANTLKGIDALRVYIRPGQKVLIAGALNAFSPFKNDAFIRSRFPYYFDWRVTVPEVDARLIPMSTDTSRLLVAKDVDPSQYDLVAYFSREGVLLKVRPATELASLPPAARAGVLFCGDAAAGMAACLEGLGEKDAARAVQSQ